MQSIFTLIRNFFSKGQERTTKAKKNIIASLVLRAVSIGSTLLLVPMTINYVDASRYGLWLTISSIVGWFSFFDIGLTHGLRNKFAEARAKGDDTSAQIYVSTTYAILGLIFSAIWVIFLVFKPLFNWSKILNVPEILTSDLSKLVLIVVTYFCLSLILKVISAIIIADQQPAQAMLIDVIPQILSLGIIYLLTKNTHSSLTYLGLALCVAPIVTLVAANIILFNGKYARFKPRLSKVDFSYARKLFNLGLSFFLIQIAVVIQLETANILITRYFGPAYVTSFNIVYKYFSMLSAVFIVLVTPFWSASTEAYFTGDIQWIINGIRKYNYLNILIVIVATVMLVFSDFFYDLWVGSDKVSISFSLSIWGFVYVNTYIFGLKYVMFLNGINALKIQLWASIISPILYLITAFLLIRYFHFGVHAMFIAAIAGNLNGMLIAPIQYYQIVVRNKKGIWIK